MKCNRILRLLGVATVFALALPASAQTTVYFNNFDAPATFSSGVTGGLSGVITTESVQGYSGIGNVPNGTFAGNFLRNTTGGETGNPPPALQGTSGSVTTLTLSNLPTHTSVNLRFLLGIIDSWDGIDPQYGVDFFNVTVDSPLLVFRESFNNSNQFGGNQSYNSANFLNNQTLANQLDLGFNPGTQPYADDAYGFNFLNIPHTANTLTVTIFADGNGWQGGIDESWAVDNLRVELNGVVNVTGPEPGSIALMLLGGGIAGAVIARRRKA